MRFLFSIPLPLLLILITFDSFDTKAAPYDQSAIKSSHASTTDIRFVNSSYAYKRDARLIGLNKFGQAEDDVKPMALGSLGDSSGTETAENYDDLSFDELEKKKNAAEEKQKELKDEVDKARTALAEKRKDAKGPLEDYEKKKKAYEDLKKSTEGMNKDLKKAEAEFEEAQSQATLATETFDELEGIKADIEEANERVTYVEKASTRKPEAENELNNLNTECLKVQGSTKGKLNRDITTKNTTRNTIQVDVDAQEREIIKCRPNCGGAETALTKRKGELQKAVNEYNEAVNLLTLFLECPDKKRLLTNEISDLTELLKDPAGNLEQAKNYASELENKSKLPLYENAEEKKTKANGILSAKLEAKKLAEQSREFNPDQVQKAEEATTQAKAQWNLSEPDYLKFTAEIADLERTLQDIEKKFAKDGEVVTALQQVYEKKLSEKKPNQGSSTIIAVCAVVGVLLAVGGIAAIFFILKRRKAAKKDAEKPVDSKAPPDSADSSATPAQAASAPPPEPPVSAKKESGSGQLALPPVPPPEPSTPVVAKNEITPYIKKGVGQDLHLTNLPIGTATELDFAAMIRELAEPDSNVHISGKMYLFVKKSGVLGTMQRWMIGTDLTSLVLDARLFKTNLWDDNRHNEVEVRKLTTVRTKNDSANPIFSAADASIAIYEEEIHSAADKAVVKKYSDLDLAAVGKIVPLTRHYKVAPAPELRQPAGADGETDDLPSWIRQVKDAGRIGLLHEVYESLRMEAHQTAVREMLPDIAALFDSADDEQVSCESKFMKEARTMLSGVLAKSIEGRPLDNPFEITEIPEAAEIEADEAALSESPPTPRESSGREHKRRHDDHDKNGEDSERKAKRNKGSDKSKRDSDESDDSRKKEESGQVSNGTETPEAPKARDWGAEGQQERIVMLDGGPLPDLNEVFYDKNKNERTMPSVKERKALLAKIKTAVNNKKPYKYTSEEVLMVVWCTVKSQEKLDRLIELEGDDVPSVAVGDLHGKADVVTKVIDPLAGLKKAGKMTEEKMLEHVFIFLGDYVDRGPRSLDTVMLLFLYMSLYPRNFIVLRGNHEFYETNLCYGFRREMGKHFADDKEARAMHFYLNFAFAYLPLACLAKYKNGNFLFMHGCIPHNLENLKDINKIWTFIWRFDLFSGKPMERWRLWAMALVWNDPAYILKYRVSSRGAGYELGPKLIKEFCEKHGIKLIVRGHQMVPNGFENFGDLILTVFSSPNYEIRATNRGAIFLITRDMVLVPIILAPYHAKNVEGKLGEELIKYLTERGENVKIHHNANNVYITFKGAEASLKNPDDTPSQTMKS